jgi:colanic acid biosynthesis glycosyl transferase WcaI
MIKSSFDLAAPPMNKSGRPLRVVFVTITFAPESGAQRGLPLAKYLADRGYDVRVLTGFPQYPLGRVFEGYKMRPWQREVMDGIPILRVPLYPSHDTNPVRRVWTYVSFMLAASVIGVPLVGPADVVYLYEPPPTNGLASLLLKWFRGAPIVHHIADMWPETVLSSGMLPGPLHTFAHTTIGSYCKFLYKQAAIMSVLSPGFKRLLVERGVPPEKVMVSYNWADEEMFYPMPRDEALAGELGFAGRFNIVYSGNVGPLQGIDNVVRAAALVRDSHPAIQVIIVGTGPKLAEVQSLAAELRATNVRFIPRREYWEMGRVNAVSDVMMVHLRDFEFLAATIPSKLQVGLASGRPLLAAVRGDTADIVRAAQAGLTCQPDDPKALAAAMIQLATTSTADLEAMGARGRDFYLRNLSLAAVGAQTDDALRRAYAGRSDAPAETTAIPTSLLNAS